MTQKGTIDSIINFLPILKSILSEYMILRIINWLIKKKAW